MYWAKAVVRGTLGLDRFTKIAQDCFRWCGAYHEQIPHMHVPMDETGSMKSRKALNRTTKAVPDGR